jgi:hypothetical protein
MRRQRRHAPRVMTIKDAQEIARRIREGQRISTVNGDPDRGSIKRNSRARNR